MAKGYGFNWLIQRLLPFVLLIGSIGLFAAAPSATAAAASVAVNGAVFTVSNPALTADTGKLSTLQFTLTLKNNGKSAVKYSDYGVRVVTSGGSNISAKLLVKQTARIAAGQSLDYVYTAQVPATLSLAQLKVVIFKWNAGKANLMQDYGALLLANAPAAAAAYTDVKLSLADSALPADALLRLQAKQSYTVHEGGKVYLYTDLYATNKSSSAVALPAALLFQLKSSTQSYASSLAYGSGSTLQPGEQAKLTVKTQVVAGAAVKDLQLVFYASAQSKPLLLGGLSLAGTEHTVAIGAAAAYHPAAGTSGITFQVTEATATKQSDGTHVIARVEVRNTGKTTESIPELTAAFLSGTADSKPANRDTLTHPAELAAGAATTYYFQYVTSGAVDASKLKLVLLESKESVAATATGAADASGTASVLPVTLVSLAALKQAAVAGPYSYSPYSLGEPFVLPANSALAADVEIALMDLRLFENTETGYKTAVGKYKFTNKGQSPVSVPALQTDLVGDSGGVYTGSGPTADIQLMPSTSYLASYAYILPDEEEGMDFQLKFLDEVTLKNEKLTLAGYRVSLQTTTYDHKVPYTLNPYPYAVNIKTSDMYWNYTSNGNVYTGTLKLEVEVNPLERSGADSNFNSLLFELVNHLGQTVSSTTVSLAGEQKLMSGAQTITLEKVPSDVIVNNNTLRIYEVIQTPNGSVKHLLKQLLNP